ncbi:MAG: hypothetical protein EZS28_031117 [Streblomastix strix]|uniref:Uncharacterized protein n=1 Tax=Streblomastix strix TaxID=222440 RepID=A0A5J4URQ3_9EUKA|nr:MAG: hypothetical protein EZS28_031117 [Streblomastix strix]
MVHDQSYLILRSRSHTSRRQKETYPTEAITYKQIVPHPICNYNSILDVVLVGPIIKQFKTSKQTLFLQNTEEIALNKHVSGDAHQKQELQKRVSSINCTVLELIEVAGVNLNENLQR